MSPSILKDSGRYNALKFRSMFAMMVLVSSAVVAIFLGCGADHSTEPTKLSIHSQEPGWMPPEPREATEKRNICAISGPTLESFEIEGEVVDIYSCFFDQSTESIEIFVRWPESQTCRTVRLFREEYATDYNGFVATSSLANDLKFGVAFSWILDQGIGTSAEWTDSDYLKASISHDANDIATEIYDVNNVEESIVWDTNNASGLLGKEPEYAAFYDANIAGTSLENNADGERLTRLISHDPFLTWLFSYYGYTTMDIDGWDWKRGLINIGGTAKCLLGGGVMNPLCHVYIGTTVAFAIADVVCDLTDDCE